MGEVASKCQALDEGPKARRTFEQSSANRGIPESYRVVVQEKSQLALQQTVDVDHALWSGELTVYVSPRKANSPSPSCNLSWIACRAPIFLLALIDVVDITFIFLPLIRESEGRGAMNLLLHPKR